MCFFRLFLSTKVADSSASYMEVMYPVCMGHRADNFERFRMNDQAAEYDRIIRPIEDQMIRSIWRIVRNPQDAEDVLQGALLSIWRHWDRVCRHPNAKALVLKICIDSAYDSTRRRLRELDKWKTHGVHAEAVDQSPTPPQSAQNSELYHLLISAIDCLPRQQATATLMRIVQGQSYREIAAVVRCTEATARKHVARGRERLQPALAHINHADSKASATK